MMFSAPFFLLSYLSYYWVVSSLYILDISPLLELDFSNIFLCSVGLCFHFIGWYLLKHICFNFVPELVSFLCTGKGPMFLHMLSDCVQHHLSKRYSFPLEWSWHPCSKSVDQIRLSLNSIPLIYEFISIPLYWSLKLGRVSQPALFFFKVVFSDSESLEFPYSS